MTQRVLQYRSFYSAAKAGSPRPTMLSLAEAGAAVAASVVERVTGDGASGSPGSSHGRTPPSSRAAASPASPHLIDGDALHDDASAEYGSPESGDYGSLRSPVTTPQKKTVGGKFSTDVAVLQATIAKLQGAVGALTEIVEGHLKVTPATAAVHVAAPTAVGGSSVYNRTTPQVSSLFQVHQAPSVAASPRPWGDAGHGPNDSAVSFRLAPVAKHCDVANVVDDFGDGNVTVNQYVMLQCIGRGCQGEVWQAWDDVENEYRAVKVMARPHLEGCSSVRTQLDRKRRQAALAREIAVMKKCRHRNVVSLYEVIDDEAVESVYIVMQYVERGCLMTMAGDGTCQRLEPSLVSSFARQLAAGLQYLHDHDVLHRDIKPENVLLDGDDNVCLADFGVSAQLSDIDADERRRKVIKRCISSVSTDFETSADRVSISDATDENAISRGVTSDMLGDDDDDHDDHDLADSTNMGGPGGLRGGLTAAAVATAKGTPAVMAPEMIEDAAGCDAKPADVWALGLTFFAMLFGRLPWPLENNAAFIQDVVGAELVVPDVFEDVLVVDDDDEHGEEALNDQLNKMWAKLLHGMLRKNPRQRCSVRQARAKIHDIAAVYEQKALEVNDDDLADAVTTKVLVDVAPSRQVTANFDHLPAFQSRQPTAVVEGGSFAGEPFRMTVRQASSVTYSPKDAPLGASSPPRAAGPQGVLSPGEATRSFMDRISQYDATAMDSFGQGAESPVMSARRSRSQ
jgi:serine/threonine protein kinase